MARSARLLARILVRSPRRARIVDENVHLSEFRNRLFGQSDDLIILRIVRSDPIGLYAQAEQMLLSLLEVCGLPRGQKNPRPLLAQGFRYLQPEPPRTAGNERRLAAQIECLLYAAHIVISPLASFVRRSFWVECATGR